MLDRLPQIGQRRRPGIDHVLAGYQQRPQAARGKLGLAGEKLGPVEPAHVGDAVAARLRLDGVELGEVGLAPGHDRGPGLQQRQVQPLADGEVLGVALAHALQLEASRRGVEAGVQERAVGLAGAGQDVGGAFQDDDAQPAQRQPARDRAADHARPDHGDVERRSIGSCGQGTIQKSVKRRRRLGRRPLRGQRALKDRAPSRGAAVRRSCSRSCRRRRSWPRAGWWPAGPRSPARACAGSPPGAGPRSVTGITKAPGPPITQSR